MKFEYNSRIIEQLGAELITSDEMALSELIKNSYDAYARNIGIHFIKNSPVLPLNFLTNVSPGIVGIVTESLNADNLIVVDDNGDGMDYTSLQDGFFTIGSDLKKNINSIPGNKRPVLGNKGLGRLASQRLGHTMYVETTAKGCDEVFLTKIQWSEFIEKNDTEAPEYSFPKDDKDISYTRIWIITSDGFGRFIEDKRPPLFKADHSTEFDSDISLRDQLLSTINFLYSPFGEKVNDFSIDFWLNNIKIESDFNNNAIKLAESISDFRLDNDFLTCNLTLCPWYIERVHMRVLGKEIFSTWRQTPEEYAKILLKYQSHYEQSLSLKITHKEISDNVNRILEQNHPHHVNNVLKLLKNIIPVNGSVYSFKRDSVLFSMAVESAIKNKIISKSDDLSRGSLLSFLDNHNGIKLYRDKYRIANLGDKDSDWLKLQQARTRGQQFFRFELGNSIGHVTVDDIEQRYIKETSSRQDIRNTPVAIVFKALLEYVFNSIFYNLHRNAYYLTVDILDQEGILAKDATKDLKEKLSNSDEFIKNLKKQVISFDKKLQLIDKNLDLDTPQKIKSVRKAFKDIDCSFHSLSDNVDKTVAAISNTNSIIKIIEAKEEAIKVESYNNYKLMANGLITEVLTHELHALVSKVDDRSKHKQHLDIIDNYLLKKNAKDVYLNHFSPIKTAFNILGSRLDEMNTFYHFLEKTFIKKGTSDDFETQDLSVFFEDLKNRLSKKLGNVIFEFASTDGKSLYVPKGVLIHIFYNLIDNSLYWIADRKYRAKHDSKYNFEGNDYIKIEYINQTTIQIFDSGTGVIPRCENTLFYPLESGKKKGEGRGMGLYIIKKLLESFDANIVLLPDRNLYGNRYIFEITLVSNSNE